MFYTLTALRAKPELNGKLVRRCFKTRICNGRIAVWRCDPMGGAICDGAKLAVKQKNLMAVPECRICLDGFCEHQPPLQHACACRGSAGWVHLACLHASAEHSGNWAGCGTCKEQFQGETRLAMAAAWHQHAHAHGVSLMRAKQHLGNVLSQRGEHSRALDMLTQAMHACYRYPPSSRLAVESIGVDMCAAWVTELSDPTSNFTPPSQIADKLRKSYVGLTSLYHSQMEADAGLMIRFERAMAKLQMLAGKAGRAYHAQLNAYRRSRAEYGLDCLSSVLIAFELADIVTARGVDVPASYRNEACASLRRIFGPDHPTFKQLCVQNNCVHELSSQ